MTRHDARFFASMDAPLPTLQLRDGLVLEELAGEGGMGSVFRARDERLGRTVAVKLLRAEEADTRERAAREARALARLSHPGVVQIHDVGEDDGRPYLVMEWVEGPSLAELGVLEADRASALLADVAEAVAHAHERGLVHRDLKPQNVLLAEGERVKITDFGIARSPSERDWVLTRPDRVAGTPFYLPPEARVGAEPNPRWDVFALGVLLREMLTGTPDGDLSGHSTSLRALVSRATDPQPLERFANASEFRAALLSLRSKGGLDTLPPEYPSLAAAASLAATVASACVLWVIYLSFSPEAIPKAEVRPLLMLTAGELGEGRVRVLAQFRIGPTLLAALAVSVMLAGYGGIRRYWRVHGLERESPNTRIARSRTVLALGVFQTCAYAGRVVLLDGSTFAAFIPVLGGLVELVTLWFFWITLLEMQRIGRPWHREWPLWVGLGFALVPPVADMARHVWSWLP
ncbi:MAG: serine/threonine-protein kinase [Myxococcota bacterium]